MAIGNSSSYLRSMNQSTVQTIGAGEENREVPSPPSAKRPRLANYGGGNPTTTEHNPHVDNRNKSSMQPSLRFSREHPQLSPLKCYRCGCDFRGTAAASREDTAIRKLKEITASFCFQLRKAHQEVERLKRENVNLLSQVEILKTEPKTTRTRVRQEQARPPDNSAGEMLLPLPTAPSCNNANDEKYRMTDEANFDANLKAVLEFRRKFGKVSVPKGYDEALCNVERSWRRGYSGRQRLVKSTFPLSQFDHLRAVNFMGAKHIDRGGADHSWRSMLELVVVYSRTYGRGYAVPASFDRKLHDWVLDQGDLIHKSPQDMNRAETRKYRYLVSKGMLNPLLEAISTLEAAEHE